MQADALYDHLKSTIINSRCGLHLYTVTNTTLFGETITQLEIHLSSVLDTYANLHLLDDIKSVFNTLIDYNGYKVTTIEHQRFPFHYNIKISFRNIPGRCIKIHKLTHYYYDAEQKK